MFTHYYYCSYCFRMVITDGTGNAIISCFTPQTDGLIKDVNTLLQEVEDKNPSTIPAAILALQNTRHVFQFQFATTITKGPPTFVLKKIMDNPPAALPGTSVGPSSPPTLAIVGQQSEEYTPPPVTPGVTQESPTDAPLATHRTVQPTARKELFTDANKKGAGCSSPPTVTPVAEQSEKYTTPLTIRGATQESPMDTPIATDRPLQSVSRKKAIAKASQKEDNPIPKKQKKE